MQIQLIFFVILIDNFLSHALETRRNVLLFSPGMLRVYDNPCIQYALDNFPEQLKGVNPIIYIQDSDVPKGIDKQYIIKDISERYKSKYNQENNIQIIENKEDFVSYLSNNVDTLIYCKDSFHSCMMNLEQKLLGNKNIQYVGIEDSFDIEYDNILGNSMSEFQYPLFKTQYERLLQSIPIFKDSPLELSMNKDTKDDAYYGESYAFKLLQDYLELSSNDFELKYSQQYLDQSCITSEHLASMTRLKEGNFFEGEILTGILSPLASLGCISPRLLANSLQYNRGAFSFLSPSLNKRKKYIKEDVIRRDWFKQLGKVQALFDTVPSLTATTSWSNEYKYWRGFLQREAYISTCNDADTVFVLLHGFGGSSDQFERLATELASKYIVTSVDMLGFGRSEKPPVSYNQYFWRDQVVDFIKSVRVKYGVNKKIILGGNSIGGYIITAAAAQLAVEGYQVSGLVLFNSAGKILDTPGTAPDEKPLFPEYKGPSSIVLRSFGNLFINILRPRVPQTLAWLYPSNPGRATEGLAEDIIRDSYDLVATDVVASGAKLPTPVSMNKLLSQYTGPVLVAQGALDPLNNSPKRAAALAAIRSGVYVDLMPLGHCPMDENPTMVASSINKWISATLK